MAKFKKINKLILVIMLLVLALFLLEMMLRLGGVLYLHLKYPTKPIKADLNGFNILCLGDSFTQGFGAPYGKSYPEQLQELIKGQTNKNITVYKEFHINSSTILKYLEKDIAIYDSDLIIIMTGCNDQWNMENCSDAAFGDSNFLKKADIFLGGFRVYKLIKISFLNLRTLIAKKDFKFIEEGSIDSKITYFSIPEAMKHFRLGEDYMYEGEYELALDEFNIAENLEPQNPWVHWRKACIYIQAMGKPILGKKEIYLALRHGDSSVVEYVFMLLFELSRYDSKAYAMIKEMESIIDTKRNERDKIKSKRNLKRLSLLHSDKRSLEKIIEYNLKEIIKTIKGKNIEVILMHYPIGIPYVKMVTDKVSTLSGIIIVDNNKIFADKLKTLKREDLFIADGHCNANGYKLIAENLYKVLIEERMFDDLGNKRPSN